jgi:hypothetical protein
VGTVYRNRDGSKPADAVVKVIQQLTGENELSLDEWVEQARKPKPSKRKSASTDTVKIKDAISRLEEAGTHSELRSVIQSLKLSAGEWKALAKTVTGKTGKSGKDAKDLAETHFSNLLLMEERVSSVKRLFR